MADYSDPEQPDITDVSWSAVSGQAVTSVATDGTTLFGYDAAGSIVQKLSTAISISDAHTTIWFGSATHLSSTVVSVITAPGNMGYDGVGSFSDFINLVIGPANVDGNVYGPNGSNMNIDVVGGNAYMIGSNFRTDPTLADIITLASGTTVSFQKVYRSAGAGLSVVYDGAATQVIDPSSYDDGTGTLATTTAGYWTIQRIFRSRGGTTFVAYGQEEFSSKANALTALGKESFTEKSPLPFMLFRCSLVVVQGATDLSLTAQAEFFVQSSFRLVGAQSASASIPGVTNPGGSDKSVQYNSGGSFGGDTKFTYDYSTNEVTIDGKLTVTGLIDPTGLVLTEQASVPDTPAAGFGYLWTKNTTPSTMIFTDDAGTDHLLEAGGGDVDGPVTSILNSIAIFDSTDGSSIDDFDQITVTSSSDDRFLNIDMAVEFDGEVGLRIRNELGVDKTTLTYEGNNEETYFNTYGSGGLIATISGGDSVFQMSSAAANFKINGTASPDTNDIFSLVSGGSNGGSSNFLVGSRNPEGNANKAFGHFYIRTDGVNTGLYAKKSAGVSTTDWYPFPSAPQTTVANAIPTFANTTGTALNTVDTALLTSDANDTTLTIDAVSASGDSIIELRDDANNAHLTILYDGVTDIPVISSSLGVMRFQSSPAWPFSNYVDAVSPGS
ncbi:MAG: hypothetical protein GY799_13420, partial [Desulfobulbaceae bacterium]|nr:hypothetical protein [Desulfobulbaceae bacterium]